MKELKRLKIGCLEIRKASYPCEEPENPAYSIDLWYDNPNYGKESEYIKEGDWYYPKDSEGFSNKSIRHHKSCFAHKETYFPIASFEYNKHEDIYELRFICDRPMCLNEDQIKQFWKLIKYGYEYLNNNEQ